MKKTLGGDRLGSGNKMHVELHNFGRSTHDLGYIFKSSMAAGTLVPFMCEVALPGDTFDIGLDCDVRTHPTIGPFFLTCRNNQEANCKMPLIYEKFYCMV